MTTEPGWILEGRKEIGLREKPGGEHEPRVLALFRDSGNAWVRDDETPWCGAFAAAMFKRAGRPDVRPPGEPANALRAREWLKVGTAVSEPRVGDLAIFWRGSPTAATAHVGFYMSETAKSIQVLGGNQSDSVGVMSYAKDRLLGFRRVAEVHIPVMPPDFEEEEAPLPQPPAGLLARLRHWFLSLFKEN